MNNLATLILRKIVIRPSITYTELCLDNHPKIETGELSEILNLCGIKYTENKQSLFFERWNWEDIVFQQIYKNNHQPAHKWTDDTIEELQTAGLGRLGARLWLEAYLSQINVRWNDQGSINFEHDLNTISNIFNDNYATLSNNDASGISFGRFIARAGLNLIVGLSPEVVRNWINSPSQNGRLRDVQERAAAWTTYALGSAYPFINTNERLVDFLFSTTKDYVKDIGFDKLENTDLFYKWFENSSQKASGYLAALRKICPHLLRTGEEYLRENSTRWKEQWYSICIQRPNWHVRRSSIYDNNKSGMKFLETITAFPDRLDRRRLFSWQLMSIFPNTLSHSNDISDDLHQVNILKKEIQSQWSGMPSLSDDVVAKFFRFHEYDDPRKLSILQKLLTGEFIDRSELNPKDRTWLLQQTMIQLILEAMLLDIRLDKAFYGKIKHQLIQTEIGNTSIFSSVSEHEISKTLEGARGILGTTEESPYPSGVKPWREWMQKQKFVQSPFTTKLRSILLDKGINRLSITKKSFNSDRFSELKRVRDDLINVTINKTKVVRSILDEIDQTINRLNDISFSVEKDLDQDQLSQFKGAAAYWQSENKKLQSEFQKLKEDAVFEFIKSWNGKNSKDSSLNQLYIVSSSDLKESAEIAQDVLQRFRNMGVKPLKTELVGTIIDLKEEANNEWLLAPGTTIDRYNGQAYVLTPEWRYFDFIIEKSWITLANK
ncbi:MAG: hypothetical protein U0V02_07865 [Anaerolineales bacterium]